MERILPSPVQASNVCFNSHRRNLFLFSLSLSLHTLFVPWRKGVQTHIQMEVISNSCSRVIPKIPNHTIMALEHTHTHTDGCRCDLWLIQYSVYNISNHMWHHRAQTHELHAMCTLCVMCAIRKQGKSTLNLIPHTRVKNTTTARGIIIIRGQDYCKHASQMLFLHYRQCSICKEKHQWNFWSHQKQKLDCSKDCTMSSW